MTYFMILENVICLITLIIIASLIHTLIFHVLSPFMYTGGGTFVVCCVSLLFVKLAFVQVVLIKS